MEENKVININGHIEKEESVDETVFDNIMDIFSEIENDDNFGIEEIGALLALPDEQFNILSEIFLQELEKSINKNRDKFLSFNKIKYLLSNFIIRINECDYIQSIQEFFMIVSMLLAKEKGEDVNSVERYYQQISCRF